MGKYIRIIFTLIAILTIFAFFSCKDEGETMKIDKRIEEFFSDVQDKRSDIYTNFHPDSDTYATGKDSTAFDTTFPKDENYSWNFDSKGETTKLTVTSDTQYSGGQTMIFKMKEDGSDYWTINKIDTDNDDEYDHD